MFRQLIRSIGHMNPVSGFDTYLSNVQSNFGTGTPTRSEARRDYQENMSRRLKHDTYLMGPF
jgi:hypothetical protein